MTIVITAGRIPVPSCRIALAGWPSGYDVFGTPCHRGEAARLQPTLSEEVLSQP